MRLYLASNNPHKAAEFDALAKSRGAHVEIMSARAAGGMPSVAEDTGTFEGNAKKKAEALHAVLPADAWVIADDSGLCVDVLNGAPGVESAYFAGPEGDSAKNLSRLIRELRHIPRAKRTAQFVCVLYLIAPGAVDRVFTAHCDGVLLQEPQGSGGFGYDSIFVPAGCESTLAELTAEEKNRISHRALAFAALLAGLRATS